MTWKTSLPGGPSSSDDLLWSGAVAPRVDFELVEDDEEDDDEDERDDDEDERDDDEDEDDDEPPGRVMLGGWEAPR
jgi:hypothetical protein